MNSFKHKTFIISGASRGIGKAIALKLASEGANIVIAAKTTEEDPRLDGTIFSAAREIEEAGGKSLAIKTDIRFEEQIEQLVEKTIQRFGAIDGIVHNASAIDLSNTEKLSSKKYDLMFDINVRGSFLLTQKSLPHLKKSENAHILTLSPPLNFDAKWMGSHIAYTLSKYNMTMLMMGWSTEFKPLGISANSLWPKTTIDTAAVRNLLGGEQLAMMSRKPDIVAEAAALILSQPASDCSGNSFIDEDLLRSKGVTDFSQYAVMPGGKLYPDLFL